MNIIYLYHSGFLVETQSFCCIFDYYKGALPRLNPAKPVIVFASHCHADHYNPQIFTLLREQGISCIIAVLSKDIPEKRLPGELLLCPAETICEAVGQNNVPQGRIPTLKVTFHQSYHLPYGITVQTLHSTDRGVAFLVKCDDCVVYHAGDLNDWGMEETHEKYSDKYNRQMTGNYRHEIDLLREYLDGDTLDAAFLPLDSRQGDYYDRGLLYFLKKISVKAVYPMHYWEKPEIITRFLRENPCYSNIIRNTEAAEALQGMNHISALPRQFL